jgi:hypothetical protein
LLRETGIGEHSAIKWTFCPLDLRVRTTGIGDCSATNARGGNNYHREKTAEQKSEKEQSYLRGKRYQEEKAKQGGDRKSSAHDAHLNGKTADRIAEETKVDPATIRRDADSPDAR